MDILKIHQEIIFFILIWVTIHAKMRVVDLSHFIGIGTINWPTDPKFTMTALFRGYVDDYGERYWYEQNYFCQDEHVSTHLDAPAHFGKGKWHTEEIPIDRLIGPGVIINVKARVRNNPDYRATKQDLLAWEKKYGRIPNKAIVILNSGWASRWSSPFPSVKAVFGTDTPQNSSTYHFPSWHEDAITWLTRNRHINVVGVDTPSTDYGQSMVFPVHRILAEQNIPGMENVANLDQIPPNGSTVIVGVVKLRNASGGFARVIAMFGEKKRNRGSLTY